MPGPRLSRKRMLLAYDDGAPLKCDNSVAYRVAAWRRGNHTRISTPFARKYRFKLLISTCFVWKIDAASPASTAG